MLFNRSWYNRAGVERVMGFCSDDEYHEFLETVTSYEQLLVRSGIKLLKYYLDIDRKEQKRRLEARSRGPTQAMEDQPHRLGRAKSTGMITASGGTSCSRGRIIRVHLERSSVRQRQASGPVEHHQGLAVSPAVQRQGRTAGEPHPNVVFPFEEACLTQGMIAP